MDTTATIQIQQERFETLLLQGRQDVLLAEFLSDEFTRDARQNRALAPVCVRALGVLIWYDPERAMSELARWQDVPHPEMDDLVLAIQANSYVCDVWHQICRAWSVPKPLDNLVKYAHIVSDRTHAELLEALGRDLTIRVAKYMTLFDGIVARGDTEILTYIESLAFFVDSSPADEVRVLADRHSDLCEHLVGIAESASVHSNGRIYGMAAVIAGVTIAVSHLLDVDGWIAVLLGLLAGFATTATGVSGKGKNQYYRDVIRPRLGRAYARHGCRDHDLLVAWIRMNPRVSGLYPFYEQYSVDRGLRLVGTLAAGFRDASTWLRK